MKNIGFINFRAFQKTALDYAHKSLADAVTLQTPTLVVLEAPTASGKTVIAAGLLEQFMAEVDARGGRPTVLWLSYSPALNDQSKRRIEELTELACVSLSTDKPVTELERGHVYFLNVGLLGKGGANEGEETAKKAARAALRKAVLSAISQNGSNFLVVLDEAHRGADSVDNERSLVQKLLETPSALPEVQASAFDFEVRRPKLALAISATPTKLLKRYLNADAAFFEVKRTPAITMLEVADQGLLKRVLEIQNGNFSSASASVASAFSAACSKRDALELEWAKASGALRRPLVVPLLLVQVPNRDTEGEFDDLVKALVNDAVVRHGRGAAHAIEGADNLNCRYVDANEARADESIRILFYQSALDEGWDCPRAQLLLSLRTQLEEDRVTQIIGRILRMPGAEHTGVLDCDTAYLWAPLFTSGSAEAVKKKLEEGFVRADGTQQGFALINHETLSLKANIQTSIGWFKLPARRTIVSPASVYQTLVSCLAVLDDTEGCETLANELKAEALGALLKTDFVGRLDESTDMSSGWTKTVSALDSSAGATAKSATKVSYQATPDAVHALRPRLTNSEIGPAVPLLLSHLRFRLESLDEQPLVGAVYRLYMAMERHAEQMRAAVRACLLGLLAKPAIPGEVKGLLMGCLFDDESYDWSLPSQVRYPTPKPDSPINRVSGITCDAMQRMDGSAFTYLFRSSWEKTALGRIISDDVIAVFRNPESHDLGGFSITYRNSSHRLANYFPDFLVFRKQGSEVVVDFAEPKGGDAEGPFKLAALKAYLAQNSAAGWPGRIYWGDPDSW